MSIQITLGNVSDHITIADRRAILSVLDGRLPFSCWFSMGGNKEYYLETDFNNPGWFYFKTRRFVRCDPANRLKGSKTVEMEQHLKIEIS